MSERQSERHHDQIFKEIKELEPKKRQKKLCEMVLKKHDVWRYQSERDEARRLQSSGNSRRVKKGLDLQHPTSSGSCRSSMVDDDEEMALEPPSGKRREVEKKATGGWNQKGKRRCRRR